MIRKQVIERRLLELSLKEDKDNVDLSEEQRLSLELNLYSGKENV